MKQRETRNTTEDSGRSGQPRHLARQQQELDQSRAKLEKDRSGVQAGIDKALAQGKTQMQTQLDERTNEMAAGFKRQLHSVHQNLHGQAATAMRNQRAQDHASLHQHATNLTHQARQHEQQMAKSGAGAQQMVRRAEAHVQEANRQQNAGR